MRLCCVFLLALLLSSTTLAQDKTPPFELKHPTTGESGVWTPQWLQQEFLLTESKLGSCLKEKGNIQLQLDNRTLELGEVRGAHADLKVGVDALKQDSAAHAARAAEAEADASYWSVWAATSTGAASVAILLLILEAL